MSEAGSIESEPVWIRASNVSCPSTCPGLCNEISGGEVSSRNGRPWLGEDYIPYIEDGSETQLLEVNPSSITARVIEGLIQVCPIDAFDEVTFPRL